ncbi:MAG: hypothetical protein U5L72_15035 [Bacteroidales bacterium]|nr:hypothetical protein [Bacteroidales bacterium]
MGKIIELDRTEAQIINGGNGPTWNWSGKVIGAIMNLFQGLGNNYSEYTGGAAVQQALRDFQ